VTQLLVALFLVAHGAIHLAFVSPRPAPAEGGPTWPFDLLDGPLARSGRVRGDRLLSLGRTLVTIVLVGYALAALGAVGIVSKPSFPIGVVIGSVASLALLLAGFHRWLAIGILIDVGLIVAVAAGWNPA